jgi:hypothetical protein
MGRWGGRLGLLAAAIVLGGAAAGAPARAGLAALEGRAPGAPGALARELGAGAAVLRFAAPVGGRAELVVYLAAKPGPGSLALAERVALASLLGVSGEIRLESPGPRAAERPLPAIEAEPAPVPEPTARSLVLLGLALLGCGCHPAWPWSGRPRG